MWLSTWEFWKSLHRMWGAVVIVLTNANVVHTIWLMCRPDTMLTRKQLYACHVNALQMGLSQTSAMKMASVIARKVLWVRNVKYVQMATGDSPLMVVMVSVQWCLYKYSSDLLTLQYVTVSMMEQTDCTFVMLLMDNVCVQKVLVVPSVHNVKVWVISSLKMAHVMVCVYLYIPPYLFIIGYDL